MVFLLQCYGIIPFHHLNCTGKFSQYQVLDRIFNHKICCFSPISAGYFNEDDVPDILVRFHLGPGFPSYHYTQVGLILCDCYYVTTARIPTISPGTTLLERA
jgi:hypothetical protein